MRLAPYNAPERFGGRVQGNSVVGCLTYDVDKDEHNFTLQDTGTIMNRGSAEFEAFPLASPVNDFCFMPSPTLQRKTQFFQFTLGM